MSSMEDVVSLTRPRFGLDQPIWLQYVRYISDLARLRLRALDHPGSRPRVGQMILVALPWTILLISTSTLIAFALGTLLGALLGWSKSPRLVQWLAPPLLTLSAIPYYLVRPDPDLPPGLFVAHLATGWRL